MKLSYVPFEEFRRIEGIAFDPLKQEDVCYTVNQQKKLEYLAACHRINALYMIQRAGSGHIGTCFSSADIVTYLFYEGMGKDDLFFSSKGHDAPLIYSILAAKGIIPFEAIHTFRQFDGLPGHPDIRETPAMVTNTGSLGMGVSKAKGIAKADELAERERKIFVLIGDGETDEGQVQEAWHGLENFPNIKILIDFNKFRMSGPSEAITELNPWGGHNFHKIATALSYLDQITIFSTVKGQGVPAFEGDNKYHSGAVSEYKYFYALGKLKEKIPDVKLETIEVERTPRMGAGNLSKEYGLILHDFFGENERLVAFDADCLDDHGLRAIQHHYPERFVECGIAEQDMVSMAGGLALGGYLPIVHGYSCFLVRRALDQIYNNCTEGKHIIYVGTLAGVLPSNIGDSHYSAEDVIIMKTMPGMVILEPTTNLEIRQALRWAIYNHNGSVYIRIPILPEIERMRK